MRQSRLALPRPQQCKQDGISGTLLPRARDKYDSGWPGALDSKFALSIRKHFSNRLLALATKLLWFEDPHEIITRPKRQGLVARFMDEMGDDSDRRDSRKLKG